MSKAQSEFMAEQLQVRIYPDRRQMGQAAAADVRDRIRTRLQEKQSLRMVFAAAPSQNEFLDTLAGFADIPWPKITAFHMDEYIGLPADAPQLFGNFLRRSLFDKVPLGRVHYIDATARVAVEECRRYADLLREAPMDIVCMGIGENGHIAFNDPPVADFDDPEWVKIVKLDETCRQQQVNDGCFAARAQVPRTAITLTIPALTSADALFIVVPGPSKSNAVAQAVNGPVSTRCPASIVRRHEHAILYLDVDSAAGL